MDRPILLVTDELPSVGDDISYSDVLMASERGKASEGHYPLLDI